VATDQGIQQIATNAVAPATTTTPGTCANFVARIIGPNSTETDDHHQSDPRDRSAAQVQPHQEGHPDGAHAEAQVTTSRDALFGSAYFLDEGREKRTQQIKRLVRELEICRSAVAMQYHGIPNSSDAKEDDPAQILDEHGNLCRVMTSGAKSSDAGPSGSSTMTPGSSWRTPRESANRDTPDHGHRQKKIQPRRSMALILVPENITAFYVLCA